MLSKVIKMTKMTRPLEFTIISECSTTKGRVSKMKLPHGVVDTPVFMPVGTQGTLKGILPEQLEKLGLQIMLANTYHLGTKPTYITTLAGETLNYHIDTLVHFMIKAFIKYL